jgi:hypothetical protein
MNIHKRHVAATATAVLTVAIVLLPASSASAADDRPFGQHVKDCAQSMGFSGAHNPGMHRGASVGREHDCHTHAS